MLYSWNKATDGSGATVRAVLFDFKKAFDLVDLHILVQKFKSYDILEGIVNRIIDFLTSRKQRVKLSNESYSEWEHIPFGIPRVYKARALVVYHYDKRFGSSMTIAETIGKNGHSNIQETVDDLARKTTADRFKINETVKSNVSRQCKELSIRFSNSNTGFDPTIITNKELEVVGNVNDLGLHISRDLKWNTHTSVILKKSNKCLYFLSQLKRSNVGRKELVSFYRTFIRPVTEHACQVFHDILPDYLTKDIERIQQRAMRIIFPALPYDKALSSAELYSPSHYIVVHRQQLKDKLFLKIISDTSHKLKDLLPPANKCQINLRRIFPKSTFQN